MNTPVPSTADSVFNRLLSDLNRFLKPHGFRRSGQRYGRQTEECWQIIGLQKSRWPDSAEVRFTVNFGVTSKALMEFRGEDVSKMPHDWKCPIRWRVGKLAGQGDVWWTSDDGDEFQGALAAISNDLSEKAMPFLDGLKTNQGILALYQSGIVMGFEIDRDETRAVLIAHLGLRGQASERVKEYSTRWSPGPTSKRADKFLSTYAAKFG